MAVRKTCGQVLEAVKCRIIKQHPSKTSVPERAVALNAKVFKAFAGLDRSVQAQLLKTFQQWCSGHPLLMESTSEAKAEARVEGAPCCGRRLPLLEHDSMEPWKPSMTLRCSFSSNLI